MASQGHTYEPISDSFVPDTPVNDDSITYYWCAIWYGATYRFGYLSIYQNYVEFEGTYFMLVGKMKMQFSNIVLLEKSGSSIRIVDEQNVELTLYFLKNADETFAILNYLWQIWTGRMAHEAELAIEPLYSHTERVNYKIQTVKTIEDVFSQRQNFIESKANIKSTKTDSISSSDYGKKISHSIKSNNDLLAPTPKQPTESIPNDDESLENQSLTPTPLSTPPSTPHYSRSNSMTELHSSSSAASSSFNAAKDSSSSWNSVSNNKASSKLARLEDLKKSITRCQFIKLFKMPSTEELLSEIPSQLDLPTNALPFSGTFYLSTHFYCFHSQEENVRFVFPYVIIQEVDFKIQSPSHPVQLTIITDSGSVTLYFAATQYPDVMILKRRVEALRAFLKNKIPANISILSDSGQFVKLEYPDSNGKSIFMRDREIQFHPDYHDKQEHLKHMWMNYLKRRGRGSAIILTDEISDMISESGIPDCIRGSAWKAMSGITYKALMDPMKYDEIVQTVGIDQRKDQSQKVLVEHLIELDLRRSMPEHPYYQSDEGISALRRVLTAYAFRNPLVSYCQGMNFVASALLLFLNENDAFWALAYLCEDIFPEIWRPKLFGVKIVQEVMSELLDAHIPKINDICKEYPATLAMMTWIPTFLVGRVPLEYSLRMLDNIFYHGANALYWALFSTFKIMWNTYEDSLTSEMLLQFAAPMQSGIDTSTHPFEQIFESLSNLGVSGSELTPENLDALASKHKRILVAKLLEEARRKKLTSIKLKCQGKLSEKDIDKLWVKFHSSIKYNDAGLLSYESFSILYPQIFPMWTKANSRFFDIMDSLQMIYEQKQLSDPNVQPPLLRWNFVEQLFKSRDMDGDHWLTIDEWIDLIASIYKSHNGKEAFQICLQLVDIHKNGLIEDIAAKCAALMMVCLYTPTDEHGQPIIPQTFTKKDLFNWLSEIPRNDEGYMKIEDVLNTSFANSSNTILTVLKLDPNVPSSHLQKVLARVYVSYQEQQD